MIRRRYGLRLFRWFEPLPPPLTKRQQAAKRTRGPPAPRLLTVEVISTPALTRGHPTEPNGGKDDRRVERHVSQAAERSLHGSLSRTTRNGDFIDPGPP